jgi:hypothetical protein
MAGLSLITAAIVHWNTVHFDRAAHHRGAPFECRFIERLWSAIAFAGGQRVSRPRP